VENNKSQQMLKFTANTEHSWFPWICDFCLGLLITVCYITILVHSTMESKVIKSKQFFRINNFTTWQLTTFSS